MRTFSVLLLTLNLPLVALLSGREAVWVGGRKDATDRIAATDEPVVFALQAINDWYADSSTGTSKLPRRLMKIVKAETQVVAGEKLYLTLQVSTGQPQAKDEFCDVAVVSKPWLKGADRLTLSGLPVCSLVPPPAAANSKGHNSTALGSGTTPSLVGAQRPVTTNDLPVDVIVALNYAVQEVNRRSNNLYAFTLTSLDGVEATQQIVSGKLYRFKGVPLQETRCGKMASFTATSRSQCTPVQNGQTMVCDMTVWWQAWRKPKYTLEDFNSDSCHMTQNPPPPQ